MNDITGADIRCPQCKIGRLQPTMVNKELYMICACGFGKKEYFEAVEKAKKQR